MDFQNRIASWLADVHASTPLTPPPEDPVSNKDVNSASLQRKRRATSLPVDSLACNAKRQRIDDADDVGPEQSAPQSGHSGILPLTQKNKFSPPSSRVSSGPKCSTSPTREITVMLGNAQPPIRIEPITGLGDPPPEQVEQLRDRLAKGTDNGFIPNGLQDVIRNDLEVGYQPISSADFDSHECRSTEELSAIWREAKEIYLNARDCKSYTQDENAWCEDVVRPLLQLALSLYGKEKWCVQNVPSQSQSIDSIYLSAIPTPTTLDPDRCKIIDGKVDYCFSYSHRDSYTSKLYERLDAAYRREIGHTIDTFTKRVALFSGFEVKAATGVRAEAEIQMSIWIAASLRKKQALTRTALGQAFSESIVMAEPAFTIVGHEHSVYLAYLRDNSAPMKGGVHVLTPDRNRFGELSTDSVRGIFCLARIYGNVLEYGSDDDDEHGYWGHFLAPVLSKLSSK